MNFEFEIEDFEFFCQGEGVVGIVGKQLNSKKKFVADIVNGEIKWRNDLTPSLTTKSPWQKMAEKDLIEPPQHIKDFCEETWRRLRKLEIFE